MIKFLEDWWYGEISPTIQHEISEEMFVEEKKFQRIWQKCKNWMKQKMALNCFTNSKGSDFCIDQIAFLSDPSPIIGYACHSLTHSLTAV